LGFLYIKIMLFDTQTLIFCAIGTIAGFVDSIVGGGGLVQVPALFVLFPQFSVPQVIGTNRFASFAGTGMAAYQYARKVPIPWKVVLWTSIGAAGCSYLGATLSGLIRAEVLKPVILILMVLIAVYTFQKKELGQAQQLKVSLAKIPLFGLGLGMLTGFYNGLIGPGTGSLLVFGFVSLLGFSFLAGSGIAKFVNVIADMASLVFFLYHGYVLFHIALPMMLCNILGSYLGSRLAILRGNGFVRTVFMLVIFVLIMRFGYDISRSLIY
jgi:hypothetical protein